jgi:hypothetical protein
MGTDSAVSVRCWAPARVRGAWGDAAENGGGTCRKVRLITHHKTWMYVSSYWFIFSLSFLSYIHRYFLLVETRVGGCAEIYLRS